MKVLSLANRDIQQILMGTPSGHRHLRAILQTREGLILLNEATLANLVRAYITLKTHPELHVLKLKGLELEDRKPDFDRYQLLESHEAPDALQQELDQLFHRAHGTSGP